MEALRQIVTAHNNILSIPIPKEYQSTKLEVIIIPLDFKQKKVKSKESLAKAHKQIDLGGGIENINEFMNEFEKSKADRNLPNRD